MSILHCKGHDAFYEALPQALLPLSQEGIVRILMMGDVIGRPGRKIVKSVLPQLKHRGKINLATINGENLAGGFGITQKIFNELTAPATGVDVVTMGNHWCDKPEVHSIRKSSNKMVLPQNLKNLEGVELIPEFEIPGSRRTLSVLNVMGLFAMKHEYNDPFEFLEKSRPILEAKVQGGQSIVIVDVHAEASSEKQAIAWFMDGVAAGLIGTHTHTPTSDERVTRKGTAFLTDVGMTGPYESVIGMTLSGSMPRYFTPKEKKPQEVSEKDLWLCGFLLEISEATGLTLAAHRLQYREDLQEWTLRTVTPPTK
ncbi:YmdB family metallophosphoesterase [bacterium]|nr:YmdB family metallophosphoesterase [bacterium]